MLSGCGGKIIKETEAKTAPPPKPPPSVPMWLGNPSRNFFGTGPLSNDPLQVVWKFETKMISGRLHKDPWGGTSWPGQPSVDETACLLPFGRRQSLLPRREEWEPGLEFSRKG